MRARATYPNPFDVNRPYEVLMRLALAVAIVPGFGVGLLLILVYGFRLPLTLPFPQLAQSHGQVQLLGFTLLFVMSVGMQLFPRFLAAPIPHPGSIVAGGGLVALSVLLRLLAQPLPPGTLRAATFLLATMALPAGIVVALLQFRAMRLRSIQLFLGPGGAWQYFVALGVLSLGAVVVLSTWSLLVLAAGAAVVPDGLNEALIHLELDGFATSLILGVASRVFGRFLLLRTRPTFERRLGRLAALYGLSLALVTLGWLADQPTLLLAGYLAQLGAVVAWLWLVGLYDRPARESGTPYVTHPTRRWFRWAFAFLVLGIAVLTGLAARQVLAGLAPFETELSAARHAVTQGFLLVLMAGMGARLLPIYSADVLRRKWLIELTVDLLLVGAVLRATSELVGGYTGVAGPLTATGGALSALGFTLFAAGLWSSLGRLPGPGRQPSAGTG